ncbi:HigA family addiction module antitoxin [Fodinibius sediminis]|uniref:Plasmid maintenance system antidote protein, XRE family n=1 Tax=Fodinibius sediminis TaxID=1214077 RepID=A0A521AIX0_9BACT|nr:HigA family addiction module antitoxin [Fodinibius sediminis]SMO34756.1 plasmid maintenance system antidote protein, XRE family [Fodinibius sediminis]
MTNQPFIPPIHPGEILKEVFLDSMGVSQRAFARSIDVPANRVNEIVRGKRNITGDTAIRFGLVLGTSPEMRLRLQAQYELEKARDESDPDLGKKIKPVVV